VGLAGSPVAKGLADRGRLTRLVIVMGSEGEGGSSDPRRSTYGRAYWLRRCEGFFVETSGKRIGRVAGIRYGERSNEPAVLEVRAGIFGRKVLLISVDDIAEIAPESRRVILRDPEEDRS